MLAAASDLLLALTCAVVIVVLRGPARLGRRAMVAGWILLGAAALVGALRYALWPQLAAPHRLLSDLAAGFALPALVCGLALSLRPSSRVGAPLRRDAACTPHEKESRPRGALTGVRFAEGTLLASLVALFVVAAAAGAPRIPGTAIVLLASGFVVVWAPRRARLAAGLAFAALLASMGFALGLPQEAAIAGLHLMLAVAQLAWAAVWRAAASGNEVSGIRWAQAA